LRELGGDGVRTRAWMASGQVPRMAGGSGSMSGRRMLPHSGSGIFIARRPVRGSLSRT
jgi:hypothetical protein